MRDSLPDTTDRNSGPPATDVENAQREVIQILASLILLDLKQQRPTSRDRESPAKRPSKEP